MILKWWFKAIYSISHDIPRINHHCSMVLWPRHGITGLLRGSRVVGWLFFAMKSGKVYMDLQKKYIYIIWINNDKHGLNHIYIYSTYMDLPWFPWVMVDLTIAIDGVHMIGDQPRGTPCRFSVKQLKWTQNYLNWSQFNMLLPIPHIFYVVPAPWCEL